MSPKEFATKIATDGGEPDVYDLARAYLELYENWDALRANNGHYPHVNKQQAEIIGKLKSEIAKLKEELAAEKADKQRVLDIGVKMQREVNDRLEAKNASLIEALRFYAEERNWTDGMNYWEEFQLTPCGDDFGKKANSALKKWGGV